MTGGDPHGRGEPGAERRAAVAALWSRGRSWFRDLPWIRDLPWFRREQRPPAEPQSAGEIQPVRPRVLVLIYDPVCPSEDGRPLVEVLGWNDPLALTREYIQDLAEVSGGYLQYELVDTVHLDYFPRKADGFCYDDATFLRCWRENGGFHQPDAVDYEALLAEIGAVRRVESGELDELWVWGPPYTGLWESTMIGQGAYFCNSNPVEGISCRRRFVVMGFNYQRGVGEMLESFGHRAESMLARAFGSWRDWGGSANHAWDRFTAYEAVAPGQAGCGNVHFAPNSVRDYDWGNPTPVQSSCDSWPGYPNAPEQRRLVDCSEWGNGDIRAHHKWWLAHFPRTAGVTDGVRNHWWSYLVEA